MAYECFRAVGLGEEEEAAAASSSRWTAMENRFQKRGSWITTMFVWGAAMMLRDGGRASASALGYGIRWRMVFFFLSFSLTVEILRWGNLRKEAKKAGKESDWLTLQFTNLEGKDRKGLTAFAVSKRAKRKKEDGKTVQSKTRSHIRELAKQRNKKKS